ncbi:MAG TPA: hypothetical protein VFP68_02240 [Burkholderiaceae bacterium]|nr:hypothetical protein [Burkholderiaceae bacterium]
MSICLLPEVVLGEPDPIQTQLPLAAEGVQRYVWHAVHGEMLIEVRDGSAYVNGKRVESVDETLRHLDDLKSVENSQDPFG